MSDIGVPKEQQTAYQRWELTSLNGHNSVPASQKKENAKNPDQLASYLEGARKEGYAKGLQEGYAVGMAQARESTKADKQAFQSLTNAFSDALKQSDEVIAENLLALALDIAKAMLKSRLAVDSSLILPIVKDAIHYLPYVQRPAILIVNPDDAQVIRQYLMEEISENHWQIQEDANMERGGCMVETGANQIDATNQTRWKRINEALAQTNEWASK